MKHTLFLLSLCCIVTLSSCSKDTQEMQNSFSPSLSRETLQETSLIPEENQEIKTLISQSESGDVSQSEEIPEYLQIEKDGSGLQFIQILSDTSAYTRYQISYTSEGLNISGIMNIPKNISDAPLIILNHGYIDPAVYTLGRGLKREQDYLARNGFAVLHTDYRNHAFSDEDTSLKGTGSILRSKKYGADAINAVLAVQKAKADGVEEVANVNPTKVGMLGHSMGGGVTMYSLVAAPEIIDAAVLYAPVHSNEFYNFQKWRKESLNESELQEISMIYGDIESPESFESISPKRYFERIETPVQIYFGTRDESCPIEWGYEIETALQEENKQVELIVYEGEVHEFGTRWNDFMSGTVEFFRKEFNK